MALYTILHHHELARDLAPLPRNLLRRIMDAIDGRLGDAPDQYGERLRKSLGGFWKLRVGDYRVVYEIAGREVRVYGIMNRKEVYTRILSRAAKGWRERSSS